MNILAPSILSADCTILGQQIESVKEGGAQYLHLDVMDGVFVPAISYGMCVVESLRKIKDIVFDVHLMITEPIRYVEDFAKSGADIITVHLEACDDVEATLIKIKECGCKVGLSIKPGTPVLEIKPWLNLVDMVLVMSVEPGFGGQKYIEASTERVRQIREMITESGKEIDLEVDGGVNLSNVEMVKEAGANILVAGSAVFAGDALENTKKFMDILSR
jgi:ribulose-phosphate 3-epimerase